MTNFHARTITGLSLVFVLLAAIYFSGWFFALIFFLITVLGLWEFYGLVSVNNASPQKIAGTISGALMFLIYLVLTFIPDLFFTGKQMFLLPYLLPLPLFFLLLIFEIYRKKELPLINTSLTLMGIIYVAVPLTLLLNFAKPGAIRFLGMPVILVGYFAFTWIYDTSAYIFGKSFGKHKFFERISPKKTWEGTISGAVTTLVLAIVLSVYIIDIKTIDWIFLAVTVIIFGTFGDLVESLFKRSLNIKDSGKILPGHGGILDRFDTMLISAPFVFLYFFLRNLI